MREEYGEEVNGDIADDSAQHRRGGEMFDVFRDLRNHRDEGNRICNPCRERSSDLEEHRRRTEDEDRYLESKPERLVMIVQADPKRVQGNLGHGYNCPPLVRLSQRE